MRGTPAELDEHYVDGKGDSETWLKRAMGSFLIGRERELVDLFRSYGADFTFEEVNFFVLKVARESGGSNLVQKVQDEMEKGEGGVPYPITCVGASQVLPKSIDVSVLPAVDPSWAYQEISVADNGVFAGGRLVYLALRLGILSVPNPLPSAIKTFVVAADSESFDGTWSDAASRRAQDSSEEAWDEMNRVYVLLPWTCLLGPGSTGRVAGTAFGVGWACKRRIENYSDSIIDREEVLGTHRISTPSTFVALLMVGAIFMLEKGTKMGLGGASTVLALVALYRADEVYASSRTMSAMVAIRVGDAPFMSTRDRSESIVPAVFFPVLALTAQTAGRTSLGGVLCAASCLALAVAHGFKLSALGMSDVGVVCKITYICLVAAWSPVTYRLGFYVAFTAAITTSVLWFIRTNPHRAPHPSSLASACLLLCPVLAGIIEASVVASRIGWDPEPTSTIIGVRWGLGLVASLAATWCQVHASRGSLVQESVPYKLSGWSHRADGSDKVSRYIVEYGTGQGVVEVGGAGDNEADSGGYYAKWRG